MTFQWKATSTIDLVPTHDVTEEEREKKLEEFTRLQSIPEWALSKEDQKKRACRRQPDGAPLKDARAFGDIWMAAREGALARVAYFVDIEGVDVNLMTWAGATPMHRAAEENRAEVVQFLASRGAKIDARTTKGWFTPLHVACRRGSQEVGIALLELGADWEATDKYGKKPIDWAIQGGHNILARRLDAVRAWLSPLACSRRTTELFPPLLAIASRVVLVRCYPGGSPQKNEALLALERPENQHKGNGGGGDSSVNGARRPRQEAEETSTIGP